MAAARDQRRVGAAGRGARDRGHAGCIVAGKALMALERGLIELDLVAERLQTLHAAPECSLLA